MTAERDREVQDTNSFRISEADYAGAAFALDVGYETLLLRKMFGPLIFTDLRIRADAQTCEWVVERDCGDIDCVTIWREWARIPGQLPEDFGNEEQE